MKVKRCGVYLLTHKATRRMYVGQSRDMDRRWKEHAIGGSGNGTLAKAIAKHGWGAFSASVLELCMVAMLDSVEKRWILELGTLHPAGYNLTTGGRDFDFSNMTLKVISKRTKKVLSDPKIREKISTGVRKAQTPELKALIKERAAAGRLAMTEEAKEKMRNAMKGIPKSEEWKAKMRGRKKPIEWCLATAERQRGEANVARLTELARNQSAETREKIAASKRGRKLSPETCAKISASKTGVSTGPRAPFSEETRARMSASAKARCARQKVERIGGPT